MTDAYLTAEQLADQLGCSVWYVADRVNHHGWPCLRTGRRAMRFTPNHVREIEELCTERRQRPNPPAPEPPSELGLMGATRRSANRHRQGRAS